MLRGCRLVGSSSEREPASLRLPLDTVLSNDMTVGQEATVEVKKLSASRRGENLLVENQRKNIAR